MAEEKVVEKLTGIKVLQQNRQVRAYGKIVSIESKVDSKSKKEGKNGIPTWVGTITKIVLSVNGVNQNITVMGCTIDDGYKWNTVKLYPLDADKKMIKGDDGKYKTIKVYPKKADELIELGTHIMFDSKQVKEFTDELDENGRRKPVIFIDEKTVGRFATQLFLQKELLIGKRVAISGTAQMKPDQDVKKLDIDMEINSIVIQKEEEGKTYKEGFRVQLPLIINTESIDDAMKDYVNEQNKGIENPQIQLGFYVPVYHAYVNPVKVGNKEVKGRQVYVPMRLDITNNFLMNVDGYTLFKKLGMFKRTLLGENPTNRFVAIYADLSYKSGMLQRTINIEDLKGDIVFGEDYIDYVNEEDEVKKETIRKNTIDAYKSMYPTSVRGEYTQSIEFVSYISTKKYANVFADIEMDNIEIYTMEDIKKEMKVEKKPVATTETPVEKTTPVENKVETQHTSNITPPVGSSEMSDDSFEDEFPF